MKRLLFIILLLGVARFAGAQTSENLFEWQDGNAIVPKEKFLGLNPDQDLGNMPLYTFKEYDLSSANEGSYRMKIRGVGNEDMFNDSGTYDFFEIYHGDKMILRYSSFGILYDVRYITAEKSVDYFVKVPLSKDSFALFLGGYLYGDGGTTEMVVVVVSGDNAKVVFDDYAYAYKYTPRENFAMEYVNDIEGLYAIGSTGFTEAYLKSRTKYKIWKEGNMLKYKSWK